MKEKKIKITSEEKRLNREKRKQERLTLQEKREERRPIIKADRKDFRKEELKILKDRKTGLTIARRKEKEEIKEISRDSEKNHLISALTSGLLANEKKAFFRKMRNSVRDNYNHQHYLLRKKRRIYEDDLVAEGLKRKLTLPEAMNGVLFLLPWLLGFLLFTFYPIIETLIYSFSDVSITIDGIKTNFIGFSNYIYAFTQDTDFTGAIENYLIQILLYVPIITVISLILALLLNTKVKGTGFFRTIFFLPVIVTSGPVIKIFIDQGVASFPNVENLIDFNQLSLVLPAFLVTAIKFLTSEFVMILWFSGIQILVFMTGLQKIDKSVYEAASIDGASKWESFWKVTLPAINPVIVINVVFTVVMQSVFSLNPVIKKIQEDMKGTGQGQGYGYASAMAWLYFILMIVILLFFVLVFKKHNHRRKNA